MPHTTLSWLIGVGSMMGIPLMSGFASKWMLYAAALQAGWAVPAMVAWVVSLGTVFLCAKATSAVFLGPLTDATKDAHEAPPTMVWGMGFMAAGSVVLGIAPQLAVNYFLNPILSALGLGTGVQVTWFGLFANAGSFSTTGGLVLALVSLVLGGLIYAIAYVARPATATGGAALAGAGGGIFTGGEPLSDQDRLTAGDFSSIFLQNWKEFFRWTNVDAVYLGVWRGLQAVSRGLGVVVSWMERYAAALVIPLSAAVFVFVRWFVQSAGTNAPPQPALPQLLVTACGVAGIALVLAALSNIKSRQLAPLMILTGAATIAGLIAPDPWLRLGLLESGALLTVVLVWQTARTLSTKLTYLTVVLVSAFSLVASDLMLERQQTEWAWALLITSICVKLAAVPLFFWLLTLADEVPAALLGLIIAVVDIAAFSEFWVSAFHNPGFYRLRTFIILIGIAAATSLLAALLMLTQRSLKRLLVLSTVEDVGFLLLGAFSLKSLGCDGAIFAAATHALAKALLFICLSAPEADGALDGEHTGLITRYPVSAFGFLFGMLAMLGIPPMLGYIGRWRLYETAVQIGWPIAAVFILSSIFALVAYVLALTRVWWGPPHEPSPPPTPAHPTSEPFVLQAVIVALVALLLVGGIWPGVLQMIHWGQL
jgi:formate hydrogenlyase subunit 3/multisubunit Na+/H+ antiporter MnhD subunit